MQKILLVLIVSSITLLLGVSSQAQIKPQTSNLNNLQLLHSHRIIGHAPYGFGLFEGGAYFHGLAFSPDGTQLASLDSHGLLELWDVRTANEINHWQLKEMNYKLIGFPTGNTVLLETDNQKTLFNLQTTQFQPTKLRPTINQQFPSPIVISPDGKTRAVIQQDSYPELQDIKTGKLIRRFGHSVSASALSPNGTIFITGSSAGTVRIWNAKTGKENSRFQALNAPIEKIAISPNQKWIAVSTNNQTAIFDLNGNKQWLAKTKDEKYQVSELSFSLNSQQVAITVQYIESRKTFVRDTKTGKTINLKTCGYNSNLYFIRSPEKYICLATESTRDQTEISLRNMKDQNQVYWQSDWQPSGKLVIGNSGNTLVYKVQETENFTAMDIQTGKVIKNFKLAESTTNGALLDSMVIPQGDRFLFRLYSIGEMCPSFHEILVTDLQTGAAIQMPSAITKNLKNSSKAFCGGFNPSLTFSEQGNRMLVQKGNYIDIWGSRDNRVIFKGQ